MNATRPWLKDPLETTAGAGVRRLKTCFRIAFYAFHRAPNAASGLS